MEDTVINIRNLCKVYKLYNSPKDRVLETFHIGFKKRFEEFIALKNVSFSVKKGETVGIIGTNGAGKSTILKIITGVLSPSSGEISIKGKISALLELGAGFNQEYTGLDNIYLNGRMMGYTKKEMDDKVQGIIDFADIGEFINQPVKMYSSGMFARLAFAVAINVEPDILIVDEALSVGDIFFQNKCFRKFDELREKGVTILFVSHDIQSVRQMCKNVLWLDHGHVKAFGSAGDVCDMYMDEERKDSVFVSGHLKEDAGKEMYVQLIDEPVNYPILGDVEDRFKNDQVKIQSVFFENEQGEYAGTFYVDHECKVHVVVECLKDVTDIIVGIVFENKKGLPLYDLNNFINQQEVISGKEGQVLEVVFDYIMPRIQNGVYLVGAAVAKGTMAKHEQLTWLHAVRQLEVVNLGYNSSYIEIPSKIYVTANKRENVNYI